MFAKQHIISTNVYTLINQINGGHHDKSNKWWSSEQVFAEGSASTQAAFFPTGRVPTSLSSSMKPTVNSDLEDNAGVFEAVNYNYDRSQSPFETDEG